MQNAEEAEKLLQTPVEEGNHEEEVITLADETQVYEQSFASKYNGFLTILKSYTFTRSRKATCTLYHTWCYQVRWTVSVQGP